MVCIYGVAFLLWASANTHYVEMILTSSLLLVSQWPEQLDQVTPDSPKPVRPRTAPVALLHFITSRSNWSQTFWEQRQERPADRRAWLWHACQRWMFTQTPPYKTGVTHTYYLLIMKALFFWLDYTKQSAEDPLVNVPGKRYMSELKLQ